ncbi:hypothetical protein CCMA1212_004636, partial [Trichoderma ghanense]
ASPLLPNLFTAHQDACVSSLTSVWRQFPSGCDGVRKGTSLAKSLLCDPRSFWLAGDHLGRFDVTPSIRARQITPKLQGYLDMLARTFPVLGCLARPNAKCAPYEYGIYRD